MIIYTIIPLTREFLYEEVSAAAAADHPIGS